MNSSEPLSRERRWLIARESAPPSYPEPSRSLLLPFLPALPPSPTPAPTGSGSADTPCLAGTSAQHIQGEPSQISLCYFKPTKDAGPLPWSHKYLCSHAHPGLLTNLPGEPASRQGAEGPAESLWAGAPGQRSQPHRERLTRASTAEVFRVGKLRLNAHKVVELCLHHKPKFFTGDHKRALELGAAVCAPPEITHKVSFVETHVYFMEGNTIAFITFPCQKGWRTITNPLPRAPASPRPGLCNSPLRNLGFILS